MSVGYGVSTHILREASALSVLLQWALPEPLTVGRATSTALKLLFCKPVIYTEEGSPEEPKPTMKNVFFKPWIGKDYESGGIFGKKILVLGEAHICGDCEECGRVESAEECADFTSTNCIELLIDGFTGSWTGTFRKFERSLVDHPTTPAESREIWNSVAFYNYVQRAVVGSRRSPEWVDFRNSEDAFFEVIDELKPDLIIAWGVRRMYDNLPGGERWREGDALVIDGKAVKNGYYRLADGKETRVLWVYHPSSGYSWDWWHKVIKTEL